MRVAEVALNDREQIRDLLTGSAMPA